MCINQTIFKTAAYAKSYKNNTFLRIVRKMAVGVGEDCLNSQHKNIKM